MNHVWENLQRKLYFEVIGNTEAPLTGGTVTRCLRSGCLQRGTSSLAMEIVVWGSPDNILEMAE